MNEADLYQKSNSLQKRDAVDIMKEYSRTIQWKTTDDRVIDVGCGDGSVTVDILKCYVPDGYKRILGCDISDEMVRYANERYNDGRTTFMVQDIEGAIPVELIGGFDHVFSFYTLHWVRQQEKAFANIYDLLDRDGDCLLTFLGHSAVFDLYRIMAKTSKWRHWMKEVDRYVSPYHDSQEPEKDVKRMMEKIGFKNVDVQCKETLFIFDGVDILKKAVLAVNPFNIPKTLHEEFLEDYLAVVKDMSLMDEQNNNVTESVSIRAHYSLIIAYGTK